MLGLVAVRERDVREVDVEGRPGREDVVGCLEHLREHRGVGEGAVARRVHVREVEDGTDPTTAARDLEHVVDRSEVADAAHHLDSERNRAILLLEPLA